MSKHKCGTCRYFQEARLASSGWCHHPQRKTTSDILIMVRKNELACRDEWSHDLWEARTDAGSLAAPVAEPYSHHKMPPATEHEIAAVVLADKTLGANEPRPLHDGDDVVLSELGVATDASTYAPVSEPIRDWDTAAGRPVEPGLPATPIIDTGTRNAIIRAREAFRERTRQEAVRNAELASLANSFAGDDAIAADAPTPLDAPTEPAAILQQGKPPIDETAFGPSVNANDLELEPEPAVEAGAHIDGAEWATGDDEPHSDVPAAIDEASAASIEEHTGQLEAAPVEEYVDLLEPAPSSFRDRLVSRLKPKHPDLIPPEEPLAAQSPDQPELPTTPNLGSSTAAHSPAFDSAYLDWMNDQPDRQQISDPASVTAAAGALDGDIVNPSDEGEFVAEYDNIQPVSSSSPDIDEQLVANIAADDAAGVVLDADDLQGIDVVVDDDVVLDLPGLALSEHLPRICRTCRDFRPAETGDRGWCANRWAFSHRRVVAAEEPTPCESALGNWWLPVDEVWSGAADVSSHGQPTPLLDAWISHHRGEEPAVRRRS